MSTLPRQFTSDLWFTTWYMWFVHSVLHSGQLIRRPTPRWSSWRKIPKSLLFRSSSPTLTLRSSSWTHRYQTSSLSFFDSLCHRFFVFVKLRRSLISKRGNCLLLWLFLTSVSLVLWELLLGVHVIRSGSPRICTILAPKPLIIIKEIFKAF